MSSKFREESAKLIANTINAVALVPLVGGIAVPLLTTSAALPMGSVALLLGLGLGIHIVAQTVLWFGLRASSAEGHSHDPQVPSDPGSGGSDSPAAGRLEHQSGLELPVESDAPDRSVGPNRGDGTGRTGSGGAGH